MIENQDIQQVDGKTPQFRTELARQLVDLVPEAIADGKVDVAKLKELLQEDAGDTNERFGLFWPGKKRAMRAAQDPTSATLRPAPELSKDWDTTDNVFIEGDNLEVLKVLQRQYHNKIKMIYIDPPYNTGKDFVYPDNFKEGLQNYLEFSKQVDAGGKKISTNAETAGRYHSNWLNMMYPRLKLARNLLTDDGVIFISIGNQELDNLKKLCSEIFGEQNFLSMMMWRKNKLVMKGDRTFKNVLDPILVFARNKNNVTFSHKGKEVKTSDFSMISSGYGEKQIEFSPGRLRFNTQIGRVKAGSYKGMELLSELIIEGGVNKNTIITKAEFKWSQQKIDEKLDDGAYALIRNIDSMTPRIYFEGDSAKPIDYLDDKYEVGTNESAKNELKKIEMKELFDYPKPIGLMYFMANIIDNDEALILDFFSGSGTTAHAVMQLNAEDGGSRKHIQVQLPEPTDEKSEAYKAGYKKISDIARERINRAGEKIKTDFADKLKERKTPFDVGYRTYKLSDTNFTKWQGSATADLGEVQRRLDLMRDSANDNASEADLLVEVMLKMGLPLTTRTTEQSVSGLTIHQVVHATNDDDTDTSEGAPVFYLNEHAKPTLEQLRAIVTELTPSKLVILEDAFQGDNELKTNLTQTCKSYDVELWTV